MLATPLKIEEIISGHWQALQRFFWWPVMVAVVCMALPALTAVLTQQSPSVGWLLLNPLPGVALIGGATFGLDMAAMAWVGMWMGLRQAKAVQAFGKTILFVMIVPALVFCFPNVLFDVFWITWAR